MAKTPSSGDKPKPKAAAAPKPAAKAPPKAAAKPARAPASRQKLPGLSIPKAETALPGVEAPASSGTSNANRLKAEKLLADKLKRAGDRNKGGGFDHRQDPWQKGGKGQTSGGPPAARPFKGGGRGR
jgi:hypothetical protein